MYRLILFYIFSLTCASSAAQNLVSNGSFEDKRGSKYSIKPWRLTNTVDLFYHDGERFRPKGTERFELPEPRTGQAYAGIRVHPKYREFLQIRLNSRLEDGKLYLFEMYISYCEESPYMLRTIGASIHLRKPAYTIPLNVFRYEPQILLTNKKGIRQEVGKTWTKVRGIYRAKGGEKYLSIGNFSTKAFRGRLKKTTWYLPPFTGIYAYYFIDDISLVEVNDEGIPLYMADSVSEADALDSLTLANDSNFYATPDSIEFNIEEENYVYTIENDSNKRVVLDRIRFEFGSSELLAYSYDDLELLLEYLNSNPTTKIQIIGHTDNVGGSSANQKLSEKRAKSVYNYLVDNRVPKSRMAFIGKGELDPVASNDTPVGRNKNRRVEIKLVETVN